MRLRYKYIFLVNIFIYPLVAYSQGKYTEINNVKIYSEYYLSTAAKFKGTILFENGSGTPLVEWTENKTFFQCARQYGSLFIYDRSGLGKSPPDLSMSIKKPMTAELINSKLMQLLSKNNIRPPYILIAHSYGGMYSGYFARKYPELIKGILLIDPVPNNYEWSDAFLKKYQPGIKKMSMLSSKEAYSNKRNKIPAELFYQLIGFEQTKAQVNLLPPLRNDIPIIIV